MGVLQGHHRVSLLVVVTVKGCGVIGAHPLYQQVVLEPLLHVELEGPLRQSVHLDYELMRSVLLGLASVVRLNQVHLQRLVLDHDYVLDESVQFDDEVHHVLGVLLVCLDLVELGQVVRISLQGENLK